MQLSPPLFDLLDPLNPFEWPHYLLHVVCTLCDQPGVVNSGHTLVSTSLDLSQCLNAGYYTYHSNTAWTMLWIGIHFPAGPLSVSQCRVQCTHHSTTPHLLDNALYWYPLLPWTPLRVLQCRVHCTHHSTTLHGQCFVLVCSTEFAAIITFPTTFKHCTLMGCRYKTHCP